MFFKTYEECQKIDATEIGIRAKNLSLIHKNGFNVQNGFIIIPSFFDHIFESIKEKVENLLKADNEKLLKKNIAKIEKLIIDFCLDEYDIKLITSRLLNFNDSLTIKASTNVENEEFFCFSNKEQTIKNILIVYAKTYIKNYKNNCNFSNIAIIICEHTSSAMSGTISYLQNQIIVQNYLGDAENFSKAIPESTIIKDGQVVSKELGYQTNIYSFKNGNMQSCKVPTNKKAKFRLTDSLINEIINTTNKLFNLYNCEYNFAFSVRKNLIYIEDIFPKQQFIEEKPTKKISFFKKIFLKLFRK